MTGSGEALDWAGPSVILTPRYKDSKGGNILSPSKPKLLG